MGEESTVRLPASIEAAWGLRDRPARGPRPGLSLDRIVTAAVHVADTEGLGAVSMSKVAAELGASTMSLYRYVAAKDELLLLMVDAAYGPPPPPAGPEEDWRAGLTRWARGTLTALRRHPWAVRVPVSGPPSTPNVVAWMEDALRSMRETGLGPAEKMSVLLLVSSFVRSAAQLAGELDESNRATGTTPDEMMAGYTRLLGAVLAGGRFPELAQVVASGVLSRADGPDDEFDFGLARILDGVEVLVTARA